MAVEARGQNGTALFDGYAVTLRRSGAARLTIGKGDKQLPVHAITAVQFKPAGMLVNGFIQFTIPGGVEQRSRAGSATFNAASDENSVVFTRGQQQKFERLRDAVQAAIRAQHQPQQVHAPTSVADEIGRLGQLVQQGLLTQQEFAAAKARLLG